MLTNYSDDNVYVTVDGDDHVAETDDIIVKKGTTLANVKELTNRNVVIEDGYEIESWNIENYNMLNSIDDNHVFDESSHVYIKTKSMNEVPEQPEDSNQMDQPEEKLEYRVKLSFVETDVLHVGFVGGATTSIMVQKIVKLSEQDVKLPEAGVELTVSSGYKPAFRYDSKIITDLDFSINKESTIFIDAIPEVEEETTFPVYYQFIGNLGPNLPEEIMARLPKTKEGKKNGEVVTPVELKKEDKIFKTEDGT